MASLMDHASENLICGDPNCLNSHCIQQARYDVYIYYHTHPELPLYWFGINRNGSFRFLDDNHLSHLTNVPDFDLQIYDGVGGFWRDFDPSVPMEWADDVPILLKQRRLEDRLCVGLEHFIKKVVDALQTSTGMV